MATPPYLDLRQLITSVIDWTDPENPVLKTDSSGGGGGGGDVTIVAPIPSGTNTIGSVISKSAAISTAVDQAPATVTTSAGSAGSLITANSARNILTMRNYSAFDCWVNHSGSTPAANRGYLVKAGAERTFIGGLAAKDWAGIAIDGSATIAFGGGSV